MPNKREETKRMTFFIPKDVAEDLNVYLNANYTAGDSYGARSAVITNAVVSYISSNMPTVFTEFSENVSVSDEPKTVFENLIEGEE